MMAMGSMEPGKFLNEVVDLTVADEARLTLDLR
jgi:hypothetical protein